ncbi:MAG TPA: hypothetical protein VF424_13765 [Vicinamibacterales bacterium]
MAEDFGEVPVVALGEVAAARAKAAGGAERAAAPALVVGALVLGEQDIDAAADDIRHRSALRGGELFETPRLRLS